MIIQIAIYSSILLILLFFRSYEKEFFSNINKKEHPFHVFYPIGLVLSEAFAKLNPEKEIKKKAQLRTLYVLEDITTRYKLFEAKKYAMVIVAILVCNTLSVFVFLSKDGTTDIKEGGYIERPSYGERSKNVDVHVAIDHEGTVLEQDMTIEITPKRYTQETFEQAVSEAKEYINQELVGENPSLDRIYYPLHMLEEIPTMGFVVDWRVDKEKVINLDGSLNRKGLEKEKQVVLEAVIRYEEEWEAVYEIPLTILPEQLSEEQRVFYQLENAIVSKDQESLVEDVVELPKEVSNHAVYFEELEDSSIRSLILFGVIITVLLVLLSEQQLVKQAEERDLQIMLDYPELVNKFTLLLGAGMTMKRAWNKIATEYLAKNPNEKTRRYAYEEVVATWYELNNGVNEVRAYENFGRRLKVVKYMKFSSLLAQNAMKGMEGMLPALEQEAMDAFENRKELAKQLGEKASAKLLAPMMMLLVIVLLMILIPMVLTF